MAPAPPPPAPYEGAEAPRRPRSAWRDRCPGAAELSWRDAPASAQEIGRGSGAACTSVPLALYDMSAPCARARAQRSVPAGGQRGRPRLRLPGADEGDDPQLGQAGPHPARVADVQGHRVPRGDAGAGTTAFLRARVRNDGKRPLLRGPATIFGDGELVGVGEIQTTGPGGDIEFPLGADQDVKLVRQVVPTTKTTGVIIEVGGDDLRRPDPGRQLQEAEGDRRDRRPGAAQPRATRWRSSCSASSRPPPAPPDADGVVRWRVELAPGATQTLKLRYQITRPKDWQLYQKLIMRSPTPCASSCCVLRPRRRRRARRAPPARSTASSSSPIAPASPARAPSAARRARARRLRAAARGAGHPHAARRGARGGRGDRPSSELVNEREAADPRARALAAELDKTETEIKSQARRARPRSPPSWRTSARSGACSRRR